MLEPFHTQGDVLIIGAGGAGMYAALSAVRTGADNVILADKNMVGRGGATIMAQMTVAAALGEEEPDDWRWHLEDTLEAGRGLCDEALAARLCEEGPARMREMDTWKVGWARADDHIRQVMAPGHGVKRCCYVDFLNTGPAVSSTLRNRVSRTPEIARVSNLSITDLVIRDGRCIGAVGYDVPTGRPVTVQATSTIIATGGLTKMYGRTSASNNMAGEGYALALTAGAELIDMEFVQFFPIGHLAPRLVGMDPIMWDPFRYKLGGRLLNGEQEEFIHRYGAEDDGNYKVARDIATFAILSEVEAGRGSPHGGAFLSFTHIPADDLRAAFGPVIDRLAANGIDLNRSAIEVSPIAHYHMGGIRVDEHMRSTIKGLYAAGEAVGGANGANRLSGNAITEAFVFGNIAGRQAALDAHGQTRAWDDSMAKPGLSVLGAALGRNTNSERSAEAVFAELKTLMWRDVGPFRDADGLARAQQRIQEMRHRDLDQIGIRPDPAYNAELAAWLELRAALMTADAVTTAARARLESRGAHQRRDYPELDERWRVSQTTNLSASGIGLATIARGG